MFEIEIDRTFSAAHQLRGYAGKCCQLHGHNYLVTVTVGATALDKLGMSLDFKVLKEAVDELLEKYDHHNLSELPEFQELNPSSEVLAMHFYRELGKKLNSDTVKVLRVRIGESEHSAVTYFEER